MKLFSCALFILICIGFKSRNSKIEIYLQEYDLWIRPKNSNCIDTLNIKKDKNTFYQIYLFGCRGEMYFKLFKKNTLIEEGNYISSMDTVKKYQNGVDIITCKEITFVVKYFQPLRDGKWTIYDKVTKKIKTELYHKGVKVSSS